MTPSRCLCLSSWNTAAPILGVGRGVMTLGDRPPRGSPPSAVHRPERVPGAGLMIAISWDSAPPTVVPRLGCALQPPSFLTQLRGSVGAKGSMAITLVLQILPIRCSLARR